MVQGASEVDKPESTGRHKPDAHQGCVLFLEELRLYFTLSLEVELTIHDWILSKEMWANWIRPTSGPANQTPLLSTSSRKLETKDSDGRTEQRKKLDSWATAWMRATHLTLEYMSKKLTFYSVNPQHHLFDTLSHTYTLLKSGLENLTRNEV